MRAFFRDKLEYHLYSNRQIIDSLLEDGSKTSEDMIKLISHTLHAQGIWNNRILGQQYTGGVWDLIELTELHDLNDSLHHQSLEILEGTDLSKEVIYSNSRGQAFNNTVAQILYHLINHGTYHRGQIMILMSEAGIQTFGSDYVVYKR
ncbi:DinB family protein [Aureitalea marina]|uniref:Damage-inducible protein DinB n=1 Tax=Aureitalea marina TaxID=930804 RepID=A0A2S7KMT7_9FLAO|nr:DinB family protein [Aureitalea marina]PQB03945.1 hypothetical protein BST85_02750 [Aureitalea marina]